MTIQPLLQRCQGYPPKKAAKGSRLDHSRLYGGFRGQKAPRQFGTLCGGAWAYCHQCSPVSHSLGISAETAIFRAYPHRRHNRNVATAPKQKRKKWKPWKPGDPPRKSAGRPRKDGSPPVPRASIGEVGVPAHQVIPNAPPQPLAGDLSLRIRDLAGLGLPLSDIAAAVGCLPQDLDGLGVYAKDVKIGLGEANEKVARVMMERAMDGNPAAMIFWAKCRMGWNESGSRETAEGKKGREVKRINWKVVDAPNGARSEQKKPVPKRARLPEDRGTEPLRAVERGDERVLSDLDAIDRALDDAALDPSPVQRGLRRTSVG